MGCWFRNQLNALELRIMEWRVGSSCRKIQLEEERSKTRDDISEFERSVEVTRSMSKPLRHSEERQARCR